MYSTEAQYLNDEANSSSSTYSCDSKIQETYSINSPSQSFRVKIKTEICKYWQENGICPYGLDCAFAHGSLELREKLNKHQLYRTKPCKNFSNDGYCKYGMRCQFRHFEEFKSTLPQLSFQNLLENIDSIIRQEECLQNPSKVLQELKIKSLPII